MAWFDDSKNKVSSLTSILASDTASVQKVCLRNDSLFCRSIKKGQLHGLVYGFSQGNVLYFSYAAAFGYGAYLVRHGEMEFYNVFRVFAAIVFTAMSVGRSNSYLPDFTKARQAAAKLFEIQDRKPEIDSESSNGKSLIEFSGGFKFDRVEFQYPSRPGAKVLKDLCFEVRPDETFAVVGASGGGKTRITALLQRFNDPNNGSVFLGGQKMTDLNVSWLRSQIGIVSQEPVLFDRGIAENIAYGVCDREPNMSEIIESAPMANIHSFIQNLTLVTKPQREIKGDNSVVDRNNDSQLLELLSENLKHLS